MNYSIIFCLVFTLINSKVEFNHYKSFVQITKDILSDDSDDLEICEEQNNKDTCVAQKLTNKDNECCYLSGEIKYKLEEEQKSYYGSVCEALPKEIGQLKEIIELKQTKELIKEVYGFVLMNTNVKEEDMPEDFSANGNITCKKTVIKADLSLSLTDGDKEKLKSPNHCFYPIFESISSDEDTPPFIDDSVKCEKYILRDDSLKAGIECGYVKAEAKVEGETQKLKTCFPFNKDLLKKITKLELMDKLREYIKKEGMEDNVHVEFYNSKGDKVTFDSNKSIFLTNNLLVLLLFILFML